MSLGKAGSRNYVVGVTKIRVRRAAIATLIIATSATIITRADHTTAPANLAAHVTGMTVTLSWRAGGSPPDFFIVEVGSRSGLSDIAVIAIPWGSIRGVNGSAAGSAPAGTYYIRVRAREGTRTGDASNEVIAVVGGSCAPPAPPSGLATAVSGTSVTVRWTAQPGVTGYLLEGGTAAGSANLGSITLPASATSFAFNAPAGRYFLRLRSMNGCGAGAPTADIEVVVGSTAGGTVDELNGSTVGTPFGITYVATPTGLGASFSRLRESRIRYPQVPASGTLEWVLRVDTGYGYQGGRLLLDEAQALVFTTDCGGGDVSWPGSAWLWVERSGALQFNLVTVKYQSPPAVQLRASLAGFSFAQWHTIGVSYGASGVQLAIDGRIVAETTAAVRLGAGGTHDAPIDIPTVGEAPCGYWPNNQYDWGFEGVVDRFRMSPFERDWQLARSDR